MKSMAKLNEFNFELLLHPQYFLDRVPSEYWPFADLKKMLQGKKFGSNEEVIAAAEAYFESKDESFYKKCIKKLEKHWNEYITLETTSKTILSIDNGDKDNNYDIQD